MGRAKRDSSSTAFKSLLAEPTKWPPSTHKPTYDERCRHGPRIGNLTLPFRAGVGTTGAGNAARRQGGNMLISLKIVAIQTLHLPVMRTRRPFRYFWPS
jgi:hypothetical protein